MPLILSCGRDWEQRKIVFELGPTKKKEKAKALDSFSSHFHERHKD